MKTKLCDFCGEEKAQVKINNPNFDDKIPIWDVCITCSKIIPAMQGYSLGEILSRVSGDKSLMNEKEKEIKEFARESGKEVLCVGISKATSGCDE